MTSLKTPLAVLLSLIVLNSPTYARDKNLSSSTTATTFEHDDFYCDQVHNHQQRSLLFLENSSNVDPRYMKLLALHAKCLNDNPNLVLTLSGNSDVRSSREVALVIAQRRSDAVQKLLLQLGVAQAQIQAISHGKEQPKNANLARDTALARSLDRRVEFSYSGSR